MRYRRYQYHSAKTIAGLLGASAMSGMLSLATAARGAEADWAQMHREVTSAETLLSADVTNGINQVGMVEELALSADGSRVQYILYDVPYPFSFYGQGENGFTTFDGIEFESYSSDGLDVRFASDDAGRAPEQLRLTASEADHRLVSNLIGDHMYFTDGEARKISDLLIDRETGAVVHYVVDMEAETLFDLDRRTIPAHLVTIDDQGGVSASTDIEGVGEIVQEYDPELL